MQVNNGWQRIGRHPSSSAMEQMDKEVDWKEQAVLTAKNYLDYTSFSKQGLYDQLIYEGFTSEQAQHGVDIAFQ